jgi:hypothetical protein
MSIERMRRYLGRNYLESFEKSLLVIMTCLNPLITSKCSRKKCLAPSCLAL